MRNSPRFKGWREHLPFVVLRLFQHRQIELTLRPFVDERSTRFPWKELHEVYRFAQSRELLHDNLPINRRYSASALDTTLEREYIHVLLHGLAERRTFSAQRRTLDQREPSTLVGSACAGVASGVQGQAPVFSSIRTVTRASRVRISMRRARVCISIRLA